MREPLKRTTAEVSSSWSMAFANMDRVLETSKMIWKELENQQPFILIFITKHQCTINIEQQKIHLQYIAIFSSVGIRSKIPGDNHHWFFKRSWTFTKKSIVSFNALTNWEICKKIFIDFYNRHFRQWFYRENKVGGFYFPILIVKSVIINPARFRKRRSHAGRQRSSEDDETEVFRGF